MYLELRVDAAALRILIAMIAFPSESRMGGCPGIMCSGTSLASSRIHKDVRRQQGNKDNKDNKDANNAISTRSSFGAI